MKHAYAVIMAGGSGERFWPLSTRSRPKQFISLFGGKPLLSLAVERLEGLFPSDHIYIITADRLVAASVAAASAVPPENIIGEPCRRDTAAAVAVACGVVRRRDPDGVVCILTADQLMTDAAAFRQTLADSVAVAAAHDAIVTIGIQPTYPATGFGYIELGETLEAGTVTGFTAAKRFVEKPDAATAAGYLASGKYLWNAGMFIWRTAVMLEAFRAYAPDLAVLCDRIIGTDSSASLRTCLAEQYPGLRAISIDYAVMEHVQNILTARGVFGWDDVGSWPALGKHFPADASGNVVVGSCERMEASDNIVVSENHLTALIGVKDLIVVHTDRATLICPRDRAQDVKRLLRAIAERPDGETYV